MDKVTPDQLMNTVVVLLAVFAAIVTVDKVIDIFKKWRTPSTDTAKKLAADKSRPTTRPSRICRKAIKCSALA